MALRYLDLILAAWHFPDESFKCEVRLVYQNHAWPLLLFLVYLTGLPSWLYHFDLAGWLPLNWRRVPDESIYDIRAFRSDHGLDFLLGIEGTIPQGTCSWHQRPQCRVGKKKALKSCTVTHGKTCHGKRCRWSHASLAKKRWDWRSHSVSTLR